MLAALASRSSTKTAIAALRILELLTNIPDRECRRKPSRAALFFAFCYILLRVLWWARHHRCCHRRDQRDGHGFRASSGMGRQPPAKGAIEVITVLGAELAACTTAPPEPKHRLSNRVCDALRLMLVR